jgi:hypothetical protein
MVATNEIESVRNTLFHKHERKERESSVLKRLSAGCKIPFSEELVSIAKNTICEPWDVASKDYRDLPLRIAVTTHLL